MARKTKRPADTTSDSRNRCSVTSILLDSRILAGFRKRAKHAYPREHLEAVFGKLTPDGEAQIHLFHPFEHTATHSACFFSDDEVEHLRTDAADLGLEYLGSFHSHPTRSTCCHPSDVDHEHGVKTGEFVMGVMAIWKDHGWMLSQTHWSVPRRPVKVKFSHPH